jgi:glucose-6-phosphate dehydrogenase assembly protein OpcA
MIEMGASGISTIDPERIRQDLSDLWIDLVKDKDADVGVLRACSMTLIAAVDEADDPAQIGETIAMLMREHPCRAIVVRVRDTSEFYLSAQVLAQCWMPFGDRRQICCEQVEITSSIASLGDLPAVLLPLMVADLPVVLWARSRAGMKALAGIAGKVILDSSGAADFACVMEYGKSHRVGDLAWVRLTRWRELIAQIFENKCYLAELETLKRARITYTGERPTTSAFYLAAWLERAETIWERGDEDTLTLENEAAEVHTRIRRTGGDCVELTIHEQVTNTLFPSSTDYALLREELSIAGPDAVFESVLPRAAAMAEKFA